MTDAGFGESIHNYGYAVDLTVANFTWFTHDLRVHKSPVSLTGMDPQVAASLYAARNKVADGLKIFATTKAGDLGHLQNRRAAAFSGGRGVAVDRGHADSRGLRRRSRPRSRVATSDGRPGVRPCIGRGSDRRHVQLRGFKRRDMVNRVLRIWFDGPHVFDSLP